MLTVICAQSPVVDVDVDPVAVPPEPDPDHAGVARLAGAERLVGRADAVQQLLPLGDGRARRQQPAVAQDTLRVSSHFSRFKSFLRILLPAHFRFQFSHYSSAW